VHDVVVGVNPIDVCTPQVSQPCSIPIQTDGWFKLFYHTRK